MAETGPARRRAALAGAALALVLVGLTGYLVSRPIGRGGVRHEQVERPISPSFSLVDLDGKPLDLAALRGQVVLLDFWATWCGPCREEVPRLVALQHRYGPRGVQLIGLSMDDEAGPVRAFCRENRVSYPVALADAELGGRYGGVLGLPVKVLIDRDGRIAARHDGLVDTTRLEAEIEALLAE